MPYITKTRREELDKNEIIIPANPGELNYKITQHCDEYIMAHGESYLTLNAVIGVLQCVIQELYRRVVAPYEDTKIAENGDVYHRNLYYHKQKVHK